MEITTMILISILCVVTYLGSIFIYPNNLKDVLSGNKGAEIIGAGLGILIIFLVITFSIVGVK